MKFNNLCVLGLHVCVRVCETVGEKLIMEEIRKALPVEKTNMLRILISSLER